jgi:hypothetical protein
VRARFSRSLIWLRWSASAAVRHASNDAATSANRAGSPPKASKKGDVLGRVHQRAVFVLTMQTHDGFAEFPQRRGGGERVVDEARLRPCAEISRRTITSRPFAVSKIAWTEARSSPVRTKVGARASTHQEVDGFDEHGLARARFAREHVQAWTEFDVEPIDHGQMTHTQEAQHVENRNFHRIKPLRGL